MLKMKDLTPREQRREGALECALALGARVAEKYG
jgi:hypothetical protein